MCAWKLAGFVSPLGGVVESICEHVRHMLRKLKLQALELGLTSGATNKTGAANKKDNPAISELIVTFELLRSFMFGQSEVKVRMALSRNDMHDLSTHRYVTKCCRKLLCSISQ